MGFSNVFKIWSMITVIILLVSVLIPYNEWSNKLMVLFRLKKEIR